MIYHTVLMDYISQLHMEMVIFVYGTQTRINLKKSWKCVSFQLILFHIAITEGTLHRDVVAMSYFGMLKTDK